MAEVHEVNSTKIAYFPGSSIPRADAIPEIVDLLKDALAQAENGDIVGIALVTVRRQPRASFTSWHTEPGTRHDLAAGVMGLHHRVGAALNEY